MPMTSSTSAAAYHAPATIAMIATVRQKVMEIITAYGSEGCISDQILEHFPSEKKTGSINSRYSELERDGLVFRHGDKRPGLSGNDQAVWRDSVYMSSVFLPVIKVSKKKRNGYMKGLMDATRLVLKAEDLDEAKDSLKRELLKAFKR